MWQTRGMSASPICVLLNLPYSIQLNVILHWVYMTLISLTTHYNYAVNIARLIKLVG